MTFELSQMSEKPSSFKLSSTSEEAGAIERGRFD